MKNLRVRWQLHDLSLGQVWAVDLQRNEMIIKDVILVAQGEMALEEFLKMVRGRSFFVGCIFANRFCKHVSVCT